MEQLAAKVIYSTQYPDFITLHVRGELRIATMDPIEKHLESIYPVCKGKRVVLDLTETRHVSSSGWSLFLTANKRIQEQGGRFLLTGMNTDVHNAFELLQFQEFIENYPDSGTAFLEGLKEKLYLPQGKHPQEKVGSH